MSRSISVFVAMPYGDDFDEVYTRALIPIMHKFPGWKVTINRADTAPQTSGQLWTHIKQLLTSSDFVIADTTGRNPNVMVEIGIALPRQRATFLITQDEDVPSNLAGFIRIRYSKHALEKLTDDLVCQISPKLPEIVKNRSKVEVMGPGRSYYKAKIIPQHRDNLPKKATECRDLGRAARDRGDLDEAVNYFREAVGATEHYWEAKYDLSLVLSRLKFEDEAEELAKEVASESLEAEDFEHVFKAHNLLSGIYKRAGNYPEALEEIRLAYFFSHLIQLTKDCKPPHIVPIKNRAALEKTYGDGTIFVTLIKELRAHPEFDEVRDELETEIGKIPE